MFVLELIDDNAAQALASPDGAGRWLARHGIRSDVSEAALPALLELRGAVGTLVRAHAGGLHPPQHAVDLVNAASSQAAVAPQLNWPAAGRPRMWLAPPPTARRTCAGLIARAAVELLTGPDRDRLGSARRPAASACSYPQTGAGAGVRRPAAATACGWHGTPPAGVPATRDSGSGRPGSAPAAAAVPRGSRGRVRCRPPRPPPAPRSTPARTPRGR